MHCFDCGGKADYDVCIVNKWVKACVSCLDAKSNLVSAVIGRLRREVEVGICCLDAGNAPRIKFSAELDGASIDSKSIISADPMVVRMERLWSSAPGRRPMFDNVTEDSVFVLRELGRDFDHELSKKCVQLGVGYPRGGPGVTDAIAFSLTETRVIHRSLESLKAPQRWEIILGRVNWLDAERYVELQQPV